MTTIRIRTLNCPNCSAPVRHGDLECEYCGAALYAGRATEVSVPAVAQAQKIIPEMQARIKRNPYDGDAYYQLGLACYTIRLYRQAEDAFLQAQRFSPGDALVYYFAGLAILHQAESEVLSLQEFRINQMRKQFGTAASLDPNLAEAEVYVTFADALLARNREDYGGALAPLEMVVETLPKFTLAWKVLAACSFQVADYHKAIRAGRRALQLEPNDADVAYLVGSAYSRLDDKEETEAWARRVADLRRAPEQWFKIAREFRGLLA